jgi:hypothetical protein
MVEAAEKTLAKPILAHDGMEVKAYFSILNHHQKVVWAFLPVPISTGWSHMCHVLFHNGDYNTKHTSHLNLYVLPVVGFCHFPLLHQPSFR